MEPTTNISPAMTASQKRRAYYAAYYAECKDVINYKGRMRYRAHREEILAARRERYSQDEAYRSKRIKSASAYRRKNRREVLENKRLYYYIVDRERSRERCKKRYASIRENPELWAKYRQQKREEYQRRKARKAGQAVPLTRTQAQDAAHAKRLAAHRRYNASLSRERRRENSRKGVERLRKKRAEALGLRVEDLPRNADRCPVLDTPPEKWLTIHECAAKLGTTKNFILNAINRLALKPVKCPIPGKKSIFRFVDPAEVAELMACTPARVKRRIQF